MKYLVKNKFKQIKKKNQKELFEDKNKDWAIRFGPTGHNG